MSDHRYTAIFGGALLTAGVATFAVYRMLGAAATPKHEPVRAVVVAVRDVPAGVPVPREALGIASWPARVAPGESYAVADSVIGRVTRVPLMPGEPVLTSRLAARGAPPGLEGVIDPTRRAMAVRVNEAASVSGLVRSNSRVDVLMAGRGDGGAQPTARVLMTDVRVLGVGSVRPPEPAGGSGSDAPPSNATAAIVTLEVTPAQAEQLAAAEGQGAIQVVLRGYGSVGTVVAVAPEVPRTDAPAVAGATPPGITETRGFGGGGFGAVVSRQMPVREVQAPLPAHAESRHIRRERSTVAEKSSLHSADSADVARARANAGVIQVYRGGVLTTLHVSAAGAEPSANAGSAGAAPPPAVRMADLRPGMGTAP